MKMASSVEEYIENEKKFRKELVLLRNIILSTQLDEKVKWGMPTYTLNNKNIIGISAFKSHFGIWFFNGVFLSDPHKILFNAQEGKTKGLRQLRFTNATQIDKRIVLDYIIEAIENHKKGLEVKPVKKPLVIPKELQLVLNEDSKLAVIFDRLLLTKRREFSEYISSAKRKETKQKRLEKIIPMILSNTGLNDKYR